MQSWNISFFASLALYLIIQSSSTKLPLVSALPALFTFVQPLENAIIAGNLGQVVFHVIVRQADVNYSDPNNVFVCEKLEGFDTSNDFCVFQSVFNSEIFDSKRRRRQLCKPGNYFIDC